MSRILPVFGILPTFPILHERHNNQELSNRSSILPAVFFCKVSHCVRLCLLVKYLELSEQLELQYLGVSLTRKNVRHAQVHWVMAKLRIPARDNFTLSKLEESTTVSQKCVCTQDDWMIFNWASCIMLQPRTSHRGVGCTYESGDRWAARASRVWLGRESGASPHPLPIQDSTTVTFGFLLNRIGSRLLFSCAVVQRSATVCSSAILPQRRLRAKIKVSNWTADSWKETSLLKSCKMKRNCRGIERSHFMCKII